MIQRIAIALSLLFFAAQALPQSIDSRLEKSSMLIGEQVVVEVSVTVLNGDTFSRPAWSDTLHRYLEIVEESPLDTIIGSQESTYKSTITLTCFDTGVYALPPIQTAIRGNSLLSNPHLLTVDAPEVDTTAAVRDIKEPLNVPYTLEEIIEIAAKYTSIAWLALAVFAVLAYFFGKSAKHEEEIISEPEVPVDEWIDNALQALEEKALWQNGAYKNYHIALSDLTRSYLERKHKINAHELTTYDLEKVVRSGDFSTEISEKLIQAMRISDLAKFAKAEPLAAENELALEALKELVREDREKEAREAEIRKEENDVE